ncbi:hypothetical protein RHMOL_Rhmol07G0181000 [Rhododendron molle]|uniref:Uncharacterized protein n=1 Tax=Rhododendron molle TaxID=49168 RepID=A0ACC0N1T1_RHOML|nr:hypothetical protein RHMOL_Rhmol07G0181000 [Rhododendron molle]
MAALGAIVILVVGAVYVWMLSLVSVRMLGPVFVPEGLPGWFCSDLVFPDRVTDFHRFTIIFDLEFRHPETVVSEYYLHVSRLC